MVDPFISCKTITYGRVDMLEEALHSFLQQDYPPDKCEMVIVNDYPLQKLVFDHPQVRIFNLGETFTTIGDKENFATMQCKGEIICQWDDDDIALPNHLQNISKYFIPGSDLLHWNKAIFMNGAYISAITAVGNSGIVYSRKAWEMVGGYQKENAGYDMTFVLAIKHKSKNIVLAAPDDMDVSWIYYWGGRGFHMSGQGTDTPDRENVIKRHSRHIEEQRRKGFIPTGEVVLHPKWKYDYVQKKIDYIEGRKNGKRE